jgi:hypothetical protein
VSSFPLIDHLTNICHKNLRTSISYPSDPLRASGTSFSWDINRGKSQIISLSSVSSFQKKIFLFFAKSSLLSDSGLLQINGMDYSRNYNYIHKFSCSLHSYSCTCISGHIRSHNHSYSPGSLNSTRSHKYNQVTPKRWEAERKGGKGRKEE